MEVRNSGASGATAPVTKADDVNPLDEAAEQPVDTQDLLFDGNFSPMPEDQGFRGPVACGAAEITYRQLDYWARTGLVVP